MTNGSIVTPAIAPPGFTGKVVLNGGPVNFAAAQTGNGVYFQNCCMNSNNAYYKFTSASVGNIFNVNQGQITFYLSRATVLRSGRRVRRLRDMRSMCATATTNTCSIS